MRASQRHCKMLCSAAEVAPGWADGAAVHHHACWQHHRAGLADVPRPMWLWNRANLRAGGLRLPDRLMGSCRECSAASSALGEPGPAERRAELDGSSPSKLAASLLAPDSWASSWLHCLSAVLASMAGVAKPQSSISCCTCSQAAESSSRSCMAAGHGIHTNWIISAPSSCAPKRPCMLLEVMSRGRQRTCSHRALVLRQGLGKTGKLMLTSGCSASLRRACRA